MKTIRTLIGVLAGILLCFGIFLYSAQKAVENVAIEGVVEQVSEVFLQPEIIEEVVGSLPEELQANIADITQSDLPPAMQEKIEEVKTSIMEDKQISALSTTYMNALLAGAISGEIEVPNINEDIKSVVESHAQEIAAISGKEVSAEQISALTNKITEKIDIQPKLEQIVQKVNENVSPMQLQMLSMVQSIQSLSMNFNALFIIIASIVVIAICSLSFYKWILYVGLCGAVCGFIITIGAKVGAMLIGNLGSMLDTMKEGVFSSITSSGIVFLVIGVVMILVYAIIAFLRNHLVYE